MKKQLLMAIIMAFAIISNVFAAALEDDRASVIDEKINMVPEIHRYVYVMDRLNNSMEEFSIVEDADYLPVITELHQGDLVATADDIAKFNLQVQVKKYSENAVARKLVLVPIDFKHLTSSEKQQHVKLEKYSIFAVEEVPVQGKAGPIIIDNSPGFENVSYLVNMLVQLKMVE